MKFTSFHFFIALLIAFQFVLTIGLGIGIEDSWWWLINLMAVSGFVCGMEYKD